MAVPRSGRKIVETAGTAVPLGSTQLANYVVVTALSDNDGTIVLGGRDVIADLAERSGTPLAPDQSMGVPCAGLGTVWVDATVSGDGVSFTYWS